MTHELLMQVLAWWRDAGVADDPFAVECRYGRAEDPYPTPEGMELWRFLVGELPTPERLAIVDACVDGDTGMLIFDWIDPEAERDHRTTWRLRAAGGRIVEVHDTTVPPGR